MHPQFKILKLVLLYYRAKTAREPITGIQKMSQKQLANFSPNKQRTRRTLISSAKKKTKNNFVEKKAPPRPKAVGSFCKKKTANPNKLFHCNHERYGKREGERVSVSEGVDRKNPSDRTHEEKNQSDSRDTPSQKSFNDDQGETRKQHNQ
jgi:hypothetical protein